MPTMNHHVTDSTMLIEINYNEEEKTLQIKFAKGGWYEYADVPKEVYIALLNADSKGKFFLANIKDRYSTTRI